VTVAKRSLTVAGHRTSVSLEEPFWTSLAEIAAARRSSVAGVVAAVDRNRDGRTNLSAAIRVFVLDWYRKRAAAAPSAGATAAERSPSAGRRRAPPGRG
jgi:predicted DNA-binding ribbon-helix-helix protein